MILEANKGGVSDWGHNLRRALWRGCRFRAFFYPRKERNPMVNELFRWYETTALPIYNPGEAARGVKGKIPSNVADSSLCHLSVSKWCFEKQDRSHQQGKKRTLRPADCRCLQEGCGNPEQEKSKRATPSARLSHAEVCFLLRRMSSYQGAAMRPTGASGIMDCTPCHSGGPAVSDKFKDHP